MCIATNQVPMISNIYARLHVSVLRFTSLILFDKYTIE